MAVKTRSQVVCPDCRYRQKGEKEMCGRCGRSLKGVDRRWWVFVDHLGKKKAKKVGASRDAALEVARKLEARLTLGDVGILEDTPQVPTLEEYSKRWLDYILSVRREGTYKRYETALRLHILPVLGKVPLDHVTRQRVRDFLLGMRLGGSSASHIDVMLNVLSGIYAYAQEEEIVADNPIRRLRKWLNLKEPEKPHDVLTRQEVEEFLDVSRTLIPDNHPFFLCGFRTGLRVGELCGLKWGDIDWNSHFILVQRSWRSGRYGPTKSGKTRRVDLSDETLAELRRLYQAQRKQALAQGSTQELLEEPVFTLGHSVVALMEKYPNLRPFRKRIEALDAPPSPISCTHAGDLFERVLKAAGLRKMTLHSMRHTYASILLSEGVSPVYVKEQLGHSSISITVDIYGHWIRNKEQTAVNLLDRKPNETHTKPTNATSYNLP